MGNGSLLSRGVLGCLLAAAASRGQVTHLIGPFGDGQRLESPRGVAVVLLLPDGTLHAAAFGSGTGILIGAETGVNRQGQPVLRFPFSLP